LILDGHVSGPFSGKKKQLRCIRLAPKEKGILMGVPAMTQEETVQMPEAFASSPGKARTLGG